MREMELSVHFSDEETASQRVPYQSRNLNLGSLVVKSAFLNHSILPLYFYDVGQFP